MSNFATNSLKFPCQFLKTIFFIFIFFTVKNQSQAQCPAFPDGFPTLTNKISACAGTQTVTVPLTPKNVTLLNTSMKIELPTGVKFQGLISPATATVSGTGPIYLISNLGTISPSAPLTLKFNISADYTAITQPSILYTLNYNTLVAGVSTPGSCMDDGNPLTIDKPQLNLLSVTPQTATVPIVGGTFTRTSRFCNDGLGSVNTPIIITDNHTADYVVQSVTVNGIPVSLGADNKTITLTAANYGADMLLTKAECVDVVETIKVVGCGNANGGLATTISGFIDGCNNSPDVVSNSIMANAVLGGTPPNIVTTSSFFGLDSLCLTTPREQIYTVTNTGQDTARNLMFNLISNGAVKYIANSMAVSLNGVAVTVSPNGVQIFAGTTAQSSCLGAGATNNGTWNLPPLPAGKTMVIKYQLVSCCTAPDCQNFVVSSAPQLKYNKLCGTTPIITPLQGFDASTIYETPIADYPASIRGGDCMNIEIINNRVIIPNTTANSIVEYEITVPAGMTPTTNSLETANNQVIAPLSSTFANGKLTLAYRYGDVKNLSFSTLNLDFCTTGCPNCTEGYKDFPVKATLKPTGTCTGCTGTNLYCGTPVRVYVNCPGCGINCDGLIFRSYDMKRISRCQADSDNDRDPDNTYNANTSLLKIRRAMLGDTVQTAFGGIIRTTAAHPNWTYIYSKDSIPNVAGTSTPIFTPVAGDVVTIYRNGVAVCTKTINATTTAGTNSTIYQRDLSATTLACAGITNYQNRDSIYLKSKYYVSGNVGNTLQILATKPSFYATLSPNNAVRYSCSSWENTFTIAGYTQEITGYNLTANTDVTCAGSGPGIRFKASYGGASNIFPYEYRNFSIPSEFTITIPSGYSLTKVKADLIHSGSQTTTIADILAQGTQTTLANGDKQITFNLANLFVNTFPAPAGKFIKPDETYELIISPIYEITTPICQSVAKGVTLSGKFENNCVVEKVTPFSNTISDNLNNLKFKTPTINPNVAGVSRYKTQNEECFDFSPIVEDVAGIRYFFRIQANANVQITKVLANGVLINPIATDPTMYFADRATSYKICMTYNGCNTTDMINIDLGYQCSSTPPANFAALVCPTVPIKLTLLPTPLPASIQISPTPLSYIPNMCEPIDFAVIVKNSGVNWLYDPTFKINLPPFLEIVPGSSKLSWKGSADLPIPNPSIALNTATTVTNDYSATYNLQAIGGVLDSIKYGLAGSGSPLPASYREYEISYKVIAKCGFKANTGATYDVGFKDPCEKPLIMKAFASKIPINVSNTYASTPTLTGNLDAVPSCGTPSMVNLSFKNDGAGLTSNTDSIVLIMPNTAYIVPNSVTNLTNVASAIPFKRFLPPSDTIYKWKVNPNVGVGQDMKFDFKMFSSGSAACGLKDTFNVELISTRNAPCVLTGGTCAVPVSTGSQDVCFTVKKPTLTFVPGTLTNLVMGTMTVISVAVKNTGDLAVQDKLGARIKVYFDADNSGTVTASDQLLDNSMFVPAVAVGETKYYYKKINTAITKCPIVVELGGACICNTSVLATSNCNTPPYCNPVPNFNLPGAICEGNSADFSAAGTDTLYYNYKWQIYGAISINGVTTTANPTLVSGPGNFNIKWNTAGIYNIKLYSELKVYPTCRDSFTRGMTVNAIPSMAQPANITVECENQAIDPADFVGTPSDNTTFSWTNNNTAIGLAAAGSGQINTFSAPNNTTGADRTATITVTPSRFGCVGLAKTFTITQKPTPTINTPTNIIVCPNSPIDPVDFVGTPNTAIFSWTNSNVNIGLVASGNGQIVPFTSAVNNSGADYVSTITGTATFPISALGNTCTSKRTFTITDRATPVLATPANISKCPGETIPATGFTSSTNTSVTYTWTNNNTATGLAASGMGNIASYIAPANNTTSDIVSTITVTPTRLTCVGITQTFTITIKPTPVVSQPANITVCPAENINVDDFTSTLVGTTYAWTNNNTTIGLAASGTGQIADFSSQNTTTITQIANIAVTGTAPNGCKMTKNFTITVKPKPSVTTASTATYCPDDAANIILQSSPPNSSFSWTNNNTAIGLAANGITNLTFTATNTTNASISSVVSVTPTLDACVGNPTNITITVKPKPIINPLASFIVCPGQAIDATDFVSNPTGATFAWMNSNPTIGLSGSGVGQIATFNAATNTTNVNQTGNIGVVPTLNACVGDAGNFSITVKPTPTVNALNNVIVCPDQNINPDDFSSTPTGGTFSWTNDNAATGLTDLSGTGDIADFISNSNTTGANIISAINVTTTLNSCVSPIRNFTITVRPTPIVTPLADVSVCSGDFIAVPTFATNPTGSTFSWTNNNVAISQNANGTGQIPNYTAPQNFTAANFIGIIAVRPILNTCVGPIENFNITVAPRPTLNQPADISVCRDENINVDDFVSNIAGTVFSWTNNNPTIGLAASGTGQIADFTALNTTTSNQISTIKITATAPNGCTFEKTMMITVKPKPSVTGFANQSKCPNESVNIQFGSNISGASFSWTNDNPSIGLAASGNGDISFLTQNNTNLVKNATITVIPTFNACSEAAQIFTIEVKPTPVLNTLSDIIVCSGEAINPTDFISDPTGATFSWQNSNTQVGLSASGTGDITTYNAPTNTTGANFLSKIIVTPSLNGCVGLSKDFDITVKPTPTLNQPIDITVCPGETIDATDFVTNVTGEIFSWTNDNTAIGLAASGTGQIPTFTALPNSTNLNQVANITLSADALTCGSPVKNFTITVKPTPTMNVPADVTVCFGQTIDVDDFATTPTGGSFSWTNSNTQIGLPASGNGQIQNYTAPNNLTNSNQLGNIVITPTLNGCVGSTQNFNIVIKPTPAVNQASDINVCAGQSINIDDFFSTPTGGTFDWTNTNTNVGLALSGNGQIATFNAPTNATGVDISSIVSVKTTLNGCESLVQQAVINIKPTPEVNTPDPISVCAGETVDLDDFSSIPFGATFNWTNSNTANGIKAAGSGQILPYTAPSNISGIAQTGNIEVTATLNGCSSALQTTSVTVKPTPLTNDIADIEVCPLQSIDSQDFVIVPSGSNFNWQNNNTNIGLAATGATQIATYTAPANNTTAAEVGTITYRAEKDGCASVDKDFKISIKPTPTMNNPKDLQVCPGQVFDVDDFVSMPLGSIFDWTNDNTATNLAASGTGQIANFTAPTTNLSGTNILSKVTITPTLNGCVGVPQDLDLTVLFTPQVNGTANIIKCAAEQIDIDFTGTAGTTFTWTNTNTAVGLPLMGSGAIAPYAAPANNTGANIVSTLVVTPSANSCTGGTETFMITIKPTPTVNPIADLTVCPTGNITYNFTGTPATPTFDWVNYNQENLNIGLAENGSGNIAFSAAPNTSLSYITSKITVTPTLNGCIGLPQSALVNIKPTPTMSEPKDVTVCAGETIDIDNFTSNLPNAIFTWTNDNPLIGLTNAGTGQVADFQAAANNTGVNIVANLTLKATQEGCDSETKTFKIVIKPTPTANDPTDIIVCPNAPIDIDNFTSNPAGATFSWTNDNVKIGLPELGNGDIATYNAPANNTLQNEVGNLTLQATLNGCKSPIQEFSVAIRPTPTMNDPQDVFVCPGETIDVENFVSAPNGSSFSWLNDNIQTNLAANGTNDIADFIAPPNGASAADYISNVTVTPTLNTCVGVPQTFKIVVKFTPNVSTPIDIVVCPGETIDVNFIGTASTTFTWTNDNTNVGLQSAGTGSIPPYAAPVNGTLLNETAHLAVTPTSAGNCVGGTQMFNITLKPTPTVADGTDISVCPDVTVAIDFTGSHTNTTYTWQNSNNDVGLQTTGTGNILFIAEKNTTNALVSSVVTVTPTRNGCIGLPQMLNIDVKPTPTVAAPNMIRVCPGDNINVDNFVSNPLGATFMWINNNTSIGLPVSGNGDIADYNAPANNSTMDNEALLKVKSTLAGCVGDFVPFEIKIKPTPTMTAPQGIVVCPGELIEINDFISDPKPANFVWDNDNTAIGLAANGTGNISSFNAPPSNLTGSDIGAKITVTPFVEGCIGVSSAFKVTVKGTPLLADPLCIEVCPGEPIDVDFVGTPNTTFSWTNDNVAVGLPAIGSGKIVTYPAPSNSTGDTIRAMLSVTPTSVGCVGGSQMFEILIKPTPTVTPPIDTAYCVGDSIHLNFAGSISFTKFIWQNDNTETGVMACGEGTILDIADMNMTAKKIYSNFKVKPLLNRCYGEEKTFAIAVKPTPKINQPKDLIVCSGSVTDVEMFSGVPSGGVFEWTSSNPQIGLVAKDSGQIFTYYAPLNNSTSTWKSNIVWKEYLENCPSPNDTFCISVKPFVGTSSVMDVVVCPGDSVKLESLMSNVMGTSFRWVNNNPSIGLDTAGVGSIPYFIGKNTGTTNNVAHIYVTPKANDCNGDLIDITVTVKPKPKVDTLPNLIVCAGEPINILFENNILPADFSWKNDNTNIGLTNLGSGQIAPFSAATNTTGTNIVSTIVWKSTTNACVSIEDTFLITIKPTPTISQPMDIIVCPDAPIDIDDFTAIPQTPTVFWTNNNPSIGIAGNGTGQIATYNAPANNSDTVMLASIKIQSELANCKSDVKEFFIKIKPTPKINAPSNIIVCPLETVDLDSLFSNVTSDFSWKNNNTATGLADSGVGQIPTFTAATNTTGANILSKIWATPTAQSCIGLTDTFFVTVKPTPFVNALASVIVCPLDSVEMLFSGTPNAVFSWKNNNIAIGQADDGTGNILKYETPANATGANIIGKITVKPTLNGCVGDTMSATIAIKPTPNVAKINAISLCSEKDSIRLNFTGTLPNTSFSWTNSNTNIGLPSAGNGNIKIPTPLNASDTTMTATIRYTPILNGCAGNEQATVVNIKSKVSIDSMATIRVCSGNLVEVPTFATQPTGATFTWSNDNPNIGIGAFGVGQMPNFTAAVSDTLRKARITVTATLNGCGSESRSFDIIIKPRPVMNPPLDLFVCAGEMVRMEKFTSNLPNTIFTWNNDNTTFGLAQNGIDSIVFTAAAVPPTDRTAHLVITAVTDGCAGIGNAFNITERPIVTLEAVPDITVCMEQLIDVKFKASEPNTQVIWTNDNPNIGLPSSGQGDINYLFVPTIDAQGNIVIADDKRVATITATPVIMGCQGSPITFKIVILDRAKYCTPAPIVVKK